jgi:hypothetical protein
VQGNFDWTPLGAHEPMPFDTSQPNFHNNKREFLLERETLQRLVECLSEIAGLSASKKTDSVERKEMLDRISQAVQGNKRSLLNHLKVDSAQSLALRNLVETDFQSGALKVMRFQRIMFEMRLKELAEQEELYWKVRHRPPNYYARTIALRFAKFYARQKGARPTFGISRDGPHPSTDYGRLLEKIFEILGINGAVRGPATWAIKQITDADLQPLTGPLGPNISIFGGLAGLGGSSLPLTGKAKKRE